ncbi:MAG: hypothetical protein NC489_22540 [Ruminococcus flavefaciens]|nr:hypothetical protein [Ruminococcus flavefaciens]
MLEEVTLSEIIRPNEKLSWEECIPVEAEQVRENIMGYTLMRTTEGIYYVRDLDYLLERDIIGKGVFVSEHMSEVEIFIGQLLMNGIRGRGEILREEASYFSDWAMEQMQMTNWETLNEEWEPEPYLYDRTYTINYLFGDVGYDFTYIFYPDRKKIEEESAQIVIIKLLIDNSGIIRGIDVEISDTEKEGADITQTVNIKGLFDDVLLEEIIEEGILYQDKVVYRPDATGLLVSGDAAVSAGKIGEFIIDVLESKGKSAVEYSMQFDDENDFHAFRELSWGQLDEDWRANPYYDCYYINDGTYTDDCTFLYYIYPDYDKMGTETASAITFQCSVDGSSGKLTHTDLRIYSMGKKEYQSARAWLGKKFAIIRDGETIGGGSMIEISVPENPLVPDYISCVAINKQSDTKEEKNSGKDNRIYIDESIEVYSLGEVMKENMNTEAAGKSDAAAEIYETVENGWKVRQEYDAYYMAHNEKAGTQSYRYYFYWNKPGEEREMLIVFTANHCGGNSLYIYRQEKGKIIPYIDTIATPKDCMIKAIDYGGISSYMAIDLLDAYVNARKEYRYLSLDCSSFGGDMRGGQYTIVLYETVFGESVTPKELARITISGTEEKKEYSFLGENVNEAGRLRDMLEDYMYGYEKVILDYVVLEKTFSRDIVGLSEEEQAQELEELYESMREAVMNDME